MLITPKLVVAVTIGLGAPGGAVLYTQTQGANPPAAPPPLIMDMATVAPVAPVQPQLAVMDATSADVIVTPASTDMIVPLTAPQAPVLPQPGAARPEPLVQATQVPAIMADQPLSQFGLPCGLTVTTEVMPAAMVALDIIDPCQPNARVIIEHSGLNLTGQTDVMGILTIDIPAFESPAFFTVRMPDGVTASALAGLPDIASYYRVGVQWVENRELELHAMEFGATYGDPGHIWMNNPGTPDRAVTGQGGFVSHLGDASVDAPMMAEIYTFPRDTLDNDGTVRLTIEAPVTPVNCGQGTLARTLESDVDGSVSVIELTFTVPGCDAVGDYLVLQNLLQDLRVAAN